MAEYTCKSSYLPLQLHRPHRPRTRGKVVKNWTAPWESKIPARSVINNRQSSLCGVKKYYCSVHKYCVFPLIFLNSACSAAALVFYLPGVCTHTDIERKQSPENILKSSKKHNIWRTPCTSIHTYLSFNQHLLSGLGPFYDLAAIHLFQYFFIGYH